jgi:hypothetical protein
MTVVVCGIRCEECICINCGVAYTIPSEMFEHQRKSGGYHSCPNGHLQGWGKGETEHDITRRERDRLRQQLAERNDEIARQERMRKETEGKLAQATKKAARALKRAAAGVCPCCHRTVSQMARHIKSKHPDFAPEAK